ncbi:UbiH 2-polyprenyl-6-methoxyphenol hydroxylase and related FAD-dependent oxidoreductases [Rhabdaerophilaceae bacterium]
MTDFEVAIIGFGPVGAVAACQLGQAGIHTLVIDSTDTIYDKPRAVALDHEIARILQGLGLAQALADCAEPFTDSVYFGTDGRAIKRLTMLPEPHPQAWIPSMVFLQPKLEAAVRARAGTLPSVTIALRNTLTALAQDAEAVTLDIATPEGPQKVSARYVIACDGASSSTRRMLDLRLEDLGFDEPWLVIDVLLNAAGLKNVPVTSVQYCEPFRPCTYVICTGNHRRWEISLRPGEDPREMETPEKVWQLLSRWITPQDGTLWRSAAYRFHALVAESWRKKRVFIAGDAAHQQPPFLGQGLCQGLRDVANLSWKLIRCLRGHSGDSLLDTYGSERSAHVRKLTGIIKHIGGVIGERDLEKAKQRDNRLIAQAGGTIHPVPRQDLIPALDAGFISAKAHPARGTLFPQPWIETPTGRQRLDDVAGGGLRLILGPDAGMPDNALDRAMSGIGGTVLHIGGEAGLVECDDVVRDWMARHQTSHALVRPDHVVFGAVPDEKSALAMVEEAQQCLWGGTITIGKQ